MLFPLRDNNPTRGTPVVTYALVAINVVAFLWLWRMPEGRQQAVVFERGFVPARIGQLAEPEAVAVPVPVEVRTRFGVERRVGYYELAPDRREIFLSLLTCMFLHGGWLHLLGNMWFLWVFGNNVEDRLGSAVFTLFYLAGGLLASAVQWWIDPQSTTPIIGASGAVAAVLGAYAITWPWARVDTFVLLVVFFTIVELPALAVLGLWFVTQLIEASVTLGPGRLSYESGVAWWAHIGGFAAGAVLMPILSALVGAERRAPPQAAPVEIVD